VAGVSYGNVMADQPRGGSQVGCRKCEQLQDRSGALHSHANPPPMEKPKKRTTFGKLWRSVLLGVADGVPGLSQVVTAVEKFRGSDPVPVGPRLLVGWSTVALMGMLLAARLFGDFSVEELAKLLRIVLVF
jgi:hypothetical protein